MDELTHQITLVLKKGVNHEIISEGASSTRPHTNRN
jgi:hypothetical protein